MKTLQIFILYWIFSTISIYSQIENMTIFHPVYEFLLQIENKGILKNKSLSDIPISRQEIIDNLKIALDNKSKLSSSELKTLELYLKEFGISDAENSVVFYSESNEEQLFFENVFSDDEKFIYKYTDSSNFVSIIPLADVDFKSGKSDGISKDYLIGSIGARIYGTLSNFVGYNLQITNGALLSGEREYALEEEKYSRNIKFAELESDIDITESHVNLKYNWFEAGIGREHRRMGAGLHQNLFISTNSPAMDALWLGAYFKNFEYKYMHASVLALPEESVNTWGFNVYIPSKYVAIHRFAVKPSWGEIAFWENVVYSDREPDLAYLNPLSFFKSVEHSLRDRDNSVMGFDATIRFANRFQIKGAFLLDDIIFSKIGTGFWSNKTAWNLALLSDIGYGFSAGVEYSRVEPYTFSHFNVQNSMTNDGLLYASVLLPNSDRFSGQIMYWWGGRYPLKLNFAYTRHGKNEFDENGNLIRNVGGDPLQTRRPDDPLSLTFLDGYREDIFLVELSSGFEPVRALNVHPIISIREIDGNYDYAFRFLLRLYDF